MEKKVVSSGTPDSRSVAREPTPGPEWLKSNLLAVALTAFIALSSILASQYIATFLGLSYVWVLLGMPALVIVQMVLLVKIVAHIRRTHTGRREVPPEKPLDLAA